MWIYFLKPYFNFSVYDLSSMVKDKKSNKRKNFFLNIYTNNK